jgi:hypothetical protein
MRTQLVPASLLALGIVPVVAGLVRQRCGGAPGIALSEWRSCHSA